MRFFVMTAAGVTLLALAATAQNMPAETGPQNPAVKSTDANNASAPVKGANSFTMGEARSHIADKGYTHVAKLHKDENGVWRGTANKDGHSVAVSLDYQGNVNSD
jgi:hypothetical protein